MRILVIDKMSGRKSHTICMLGTLLKGVHVIFHPILALTADQMIKFSSCCNDYGSIESHNLDEVATTRTTQQRITARLRRLNKNTTATIFLFSSPQFMAKNKNFCDRIITFAMHWLSYHLVECFGELLSMRLICGRSRVSVFDQTYASSMTHSSNPSL